MDRRKFISGIALTSASLAVTSESQQKEQPTSKVPEKKAEATAKKPILISSKNGFNGADGGYTLLQRGHDTLDAVMFLLKVQEDDPKDDSVGLGGLPNEDCVVELDACVMHGPTRRAGAVAGVREIKNVASVARKVMERTNHVLLVGEGAQRFAVKHGFPKENLLTERSRLTWLLWKEMMSNQDFWGPGIASPEWKPPIAPKGAPKAQLDGEYIKRAYDLAGEIGIEPEFRMQAIQRVLYPPTGTIHCSALNEKGEMSGGTTTAGLAWKLAGRVGDSPIIGAGNFCDQDVGSAGATGTGEECIKIDGAHTIVENMRKGMTPEEACKEALQRIVRNHNNNMDKVRYLAMQFYALRKDGFYCGYSLWSHDDGGKSRQFTVHDGEKRLETSKYLLEGTPIDWPPVVYPPA